MHHRIFGAAAVALALLAGVPAAQAANFSVLHPYQGKDCPSVTGVADAMAAYLKCLQSRAPDGSLYPQRSDLRTYSGNWDRCRNGHYVRNQAKSGQVVVYNHSLYLGLRSLGELPQGCK